MKEETRKDIEAIVRDNHYVAYDDFVICNKKIFEEMLYIQFTTSEKINKIMAILKRLL